MRIDRLAAALLIILVFLPSAYSAADTSVPLASQRVVIQSSWVSTPPNIDAVFQTDEYSDPQIVFSVPPYNDSYVSTSVYFLNDAKNLYVMVDVTGDITNDPLDEVLLIFGFTPGEGFASSSIVAFRGLAGFSCDSSSPVTPTGQNCLVPAGAKAAIRHGHSPNSVLAHKIYEVSVPVNQLHLVGQEADFSSPKANIFGNPGKEAGGDHCHGKGCKGSLGYDQSTGRDNVWPRGLVVADLDTWGILRLASMPVPEFSAGTLVAAIALATLCLMRRLHSARRELHRS